MESNMRDTSVGAVVPMTAAKPDLPEKPPSPSIEDWGKGIGPLLSLTLFSLGGGLLASYYSQIHYFPDIQWEESVTYLFVLAIFGSMLAFLYALLLVVPGLIWSEGLVFDDVLVEHLCLKEKGAYKPCVISISRRILAPFTFFMFASHIALLSEKTYLSLIIALPSLVCACWLVWQSLENVLGPHSLRHLARYIFIFGLSCLSGFGSLFIFHWLVTHGGPMLWICMLALVLTNMSVSMVYRANPKAVWAIGISAALLLLAFGEVLAPKPTPTLSTRVMSFFGFGSGHPVTLVVNDKGLQALKRYSIVQQGARAPACVSGIEILSRLGSEFFLRHSKQELTLDFSLKKDAVDSWSYDQAREMPTECAPDPQPQAGTRIEVRSPQSEATRSPEAAKLPSSSP